MHVKDDFAQAKMAADSQILSLVYEDSVSCFEIRRTIWASPPKAQVWIPKDCKAALGRRRPPVLRDRAAPRVKDPTVDSFRIAMSGPGQLCRAASQPLASASPDPRTSQPHVPVVKLALTFSAQTSIREHSASTTTAALQSGCLPAPFNLR